MSLLGAAVAALVFAVWPREPGRPFCLEINVRSSLPGFAQLYYDAGSGFNETDSARIPLQGGAQENRCRFSIAEGSYSKLRFDPTDRAGDVVTLSNARLVDWSGRVLRDIAPERFQAVHDIEALTVNGPEVRFRTAAAANDPILTIELGEPVLLKSFATPSWRTLLRRFLIFFGIAFVVIAVAAPVFSSIAAPAFASWMRRGRDWGQRHPCRMVAAIAAISVILSCYPIVFFGRSFLSPNNHSHTYLLYGEMPTVPGCGSVLTDDEKGSDLGAAMWYSWPTSVVQSRALKQFELPLWNRYDSGGLPLLGQGQSMLGDPLHTLVLLGRGAAGWWDLKYLIAKFLFAASLGWCVWFLTRHWPAAAVIALSAPFIGFFSYRYSHPAFFSMCYAPLILLAWLSVLNAPRGRRTALSLAFLVAANWMTLNSGTVKEAYVLLLMMNFCGALTLLAADSAEKFRRLWLSLAAMFCFVLIATPIWLTFLVTLQDSWTVYERGSAFQIQPSLLIGLFDDIFYRQFNANELHLDPSANFLVLGAVAWFCFSSDRNGKPQSWGLVITGLVALAVVFGLIPSSVIARLPFIGRIYHVDNTFSDVAIICLLLLAGFGIKIFWNDCRGAAFRQTAVRVSVAFGCLLAFYLGSTEAVQRSTRAILEPGGPIVKSPFFWGYTFSLLAALFVAIHSARAGILGRMRPWQGFSLVLGLILLHWRHGMHVHTPFDAYVMNPQPRCELIADSSPAIKQIMQPGQEPFRAVGLNYDFAPGYGGALGLEQIDSADPLLNRHYKSLLDAFGATLLFGGGNVAPVNDRLDHDLPLFDMLNVRYYLGHPGTKAEALPSLTKIGSADLNIYESKTAWPRAFFTSQLSSYDSEEDFVAMLTAAKERPFVAMAKKDLEQQPNIASFVSAAFARPNSSVVKATDYVLTNNRTSFRVNAPSAGVIMLNEPYIADDFQLRVNGKPESYFRVNSAFRGVFVATPGQYEISFAYWPQHFTLSLWAAGSGLVLFLGLTAFLFRNRDSHLLA